MSEEEKEAIKETKQVIEKWNDTNWLISYDHKNLEILLNYIDKLQKENEELTNELSKTQCDNRQLELELEKANKQMDLDYVDNNFISKDKIKEIAQEYKPNQSNTFIESQERYIKLVEKLELLGE